MAVNNVCTWTFLMMALLVLEDGACNKCNIEGGGNR